MLYIVVVVIIIVVIVIEVVIVVVVIGGGDKGQSQGTRTRGIKKEYTKYTCDFGDDD